MSLGRCENGRGYCGKRWVGASLKVAEKTRWKHIAAMTWGTELDGLWRFSMFFPFIMSEKKKRENGCYNDLKPPGFSVFKSVLTKFFWKKSICLIIKSLVRWLLRWLTWASLMRTCSPVNRIAVLVMFAFKTIKRTPQQDGQKSDLRAPSLGLVGQSNMQRQSTKYRIYKLYLYT